MRRRSFFACLAGAPAAPAPAAAGIASVVAARTIHCGLRVEH
ncbi:MAG: hypothetical protein Q8N47_00105 [Bryobacterales bacterium]|nr:hypothetical protein [Bryobacterales bacterium]